MSHIGAPPLQSRTEIFEYFSSAPNLFFSSALPSVGVPGSAGCDAAERVLSVPLSERSPCSTDIKANTLRQKLNVKGLNLGEKWLPGARQHAGPFERLVPAPLPHHLRIISLYGEFAFSFNFLPDTCSNGTTLTRVHTINSCCTKDG